MLDALKNLGNLGSLMSRAREFQDKFKAMQDDLARKLISADAGGGLVTATVNGKLELVKLQIDSTRTNMSDVAMLEDLIVAAVSAAQTKAAVAAQQEMARMASELGVPPGMLPPGMGG
jgi:DNA-binding YbaB/EbfC family protein